MAMKHVNDDKPAGYEGKSASDEKGEGSPD